MGDTDIGWTHRPGTRGRSWGVSQGCRRKSTGCERCYAERMAARFAENGWSKGLINLTTKKWSGESRIATHKLDEPMRWRDPSTIFVNSMSDTFYEGFTNEQIAAVFGVMAACPQHTFLVLTKRAKRMREWFEWADDETARSDWMRDSRRPDAAPAIHKIMEWLGRTMPPGFTFRESVANAWPLPNCWLGVSTENQETADERIPELLRTPSVVRWLSCEPLLSSLYLTPYLAGIATRGAISPDGALTERPHPPLDWIVAGCESGPGARPCDEAWLRSLRDQCGVTEVPMFLKQMKIHGKVETDKEKFPVDLQIQEWPA